MRGGRVPPIVRAVPPSASMRRLAGVSQMHIAGCAVDDRGHRGAGDRRRTPGREHAEGSDAPSGSAVSVVDQANQHQPVAGPRHCSWQGRHWSSWPGAHMGGGRDDMHPRADNPHRHGRRHTGAGPAGAPQRHAEGPGRATRRRPGPGTRGAACHDTRGNPRSHVADTARYPTKVRRRRCASSRPAWRLAISAAFYSVLILGTYAWLEA
jgi:hypothetical protein